MADEIAVAPMDRSKKNSPLSGPIENESTVVLKTAASGCSWNGQSFSEGDRVDCDGTIYECNYGLWVKRNR